MSSPVLYALAVLAAVIALLALLVLGFRALAAAGHRMQQPATVDGTAEPTPEHATALVEPPPEVDVWTTELELWLRLHTDLNTIENTLRGGLDAVLARFVAALRLDETDLLEHQGFAGVRELIGAA